MVTAVLYVPSNIIPLQGLCANMVQCRLVKSLAGKYFYKLPKCRLLANSKCASMKKLYEAAGA